MINITVNNHALTYNLSDILLWLVIGLLAGALASFLTGGLRGRRTNLLFELVIGVVGSFIGGFLLGIIGLSAQDSFLGRLVTATIGAVVLLLIFQAINRGRARGGSRRRSRR